MSESPNSLFHIIILMVITTYVMYAAISFSDSLKHIISFVLSVLPFVIAVAVVGVGYLVYTQLRERKLELAEKEAYSNSFVGALYPVYQAYQETTNPSAKGFTRIAEKLMYLYNNNKENQKQVSADLTTEFYNEIQTLKELHTLINSGIPITQEDVIATLNVLTERLNKGYANYLSEKTENIRYEREILSTLTEVEQQRSDFENSQTESS